MTNLLTETIKVLKEHGKTKKDVVWCGSEEYGFCTFNEFITIANVEYNSGFGGQEIASDLVIVGKDFWIERRECDESEWLEYKVIPTKPKNKVSFKSFTDGSWNNLKEINNKQE